MCNHTFKIKLCFSAFLLGAAVSSNAHTPLKFTIQPYEHTHYYTGIELSDMDGDGKPEILIGNRDTNSVEIWKFNPVVKILELVDTINFPFQIHDIKAVDFNGDGKKDILVGLRFYGLYGAINQVDSWSKFQIDRTYTWQLLLADFNRDGNIDIFDGVDWELGKIFYGDGMGGFVFGSSPPKPFDGYNAPLGFNVADINNDGRPDLIGSTVEQPGGCFLRAYLNTDLDGTANWTSVGPAAIASDSDCLSSRLSPSVGDFDGNGFIDPVVITSIGDIVVFYGEKSSGNVNWIPKIIDTLNTGAVSIGAADFNGDGNLDIHVDGYNVFNGIKIYFGDGAGNFTPELVPLDHGVGGLNSFQAGDIDGDGLIDIVTVRNDAGKPAGFEVIFQVANTPIGNNIQISPTDAVSIVFTEVTHSGQATATSVLTNPGSDKSNFKFLGTYYDIKTTSTYSGQLSVCLNYDDSGIPSGKEQKLKLFHWDGTSWNDATSSLDPINNVICSSSSSLSWFAIAYELYDYSGIFQPVNFDGSSIFKLGGNIPIKFQLHDINGSYVTNALAKLYLTKIHGDIGGVEMEAISNSSATTGNLFKYDSTRNQYVFNLNTKSLSVGTWKLRISLDDGTSKTVTISLK